MLAGAVAITALFASLEGSRTGRKVPPVSTAAGLGDVTTVTGVAMMLAALLGVIATSGEFRHTTATLTYLATPDRRRVLVAKAAAASLVGACYGIAAGMVATVVGLIYVAKHNDHVTLSTLTLIGHVAGAGVGAALLAAVGVAIGSVTRAQLTGVIGVLVWCTRGPPPLRSLTGVVGRRDVHPARGDPHDHPLRTWLRRRRRAAHMDVVHHLVKRAGRVVRDVGRTSDRGEVRTADRQLVHQQIDPWIAGHVVRLTATPDRAEQDLVALALDEDHRGLCLPVGVDRRQHAQVRAVEDLADAFAENCMVGIGHAPTDSRTAAEESADSFPGRTRSISIWP